MVYDRIARASVIFGTRQFAAFALAFVGHVLIARLLSPADFGLLALAVSTLGLVNFSDLGITQALTRAVSELRAKKLYAQISGVVLNAFKIRISAGLLLGVILIIISGPISIKVLSKPQASVIIQILAVGIFVAASFGALASPVLLAGQRFGKTAIADFLSGSADSILTLVLVLLGYGVVGYAYGVLGAAVLGSIGGLILLRLSWKQITGWETGRENHPSKYSVRVLLSLGLPIGAGSILFSVYSSFVPFAIGALGRLDDVAFYSIPFALTYPLGVLLSSPLPLILPTMTTQYVRDPSSVRIHYSLLFKYMLLATIPMSVLVFLFARPIMGILYASSYLAATVGLQILAFSLVPRVLNNFFALVFQTVRRNRTIAIANLAGLVTCLPLSLIFISGFSFAGGAVALLIATLATTVVYIKEANKLSIIAFKKANLLKPVIAAILMLPIYLLLPSGSILTPIMIVAAMILYISGLSIIGGVDHRDLGRIERSTQAMPILRTAVKAITSYASIMIRLRDRLTDFGKSVWRGNIASD